MMLYPSSVFPLILKCLAVLKSCRIIYGYISINGYKLYISIYNSEYNSVQRALG